MKYLNKKEKEQAAVKYFRESNQYQMISNLVISLQQPKNQNQ